jgi:sec-independent protein translocase protein TatC
VSSVLSRRKKEASTFERAADGSMTLMEHLRELRSRLLKACIGILVGFCVGWWLSKYAMEIIQEPYCSLMQKQATVNGHLPVGWKCPFVQLGLTDVLVLKMKLALWLGLILTAPVWLYQLWAFIAPGLHRHERRWAYLFAGIAAPLFALGSVLAYFVVAKGLAFLLQFTGRDIAVQLEITKYVGFVTGLMLLFGVAFEFPLGVMLANIAGVVSGRRLLGWWRIAVFLFFVFAAVATPTADPFGMSFLALALTVLYFGAVGFAFFNDRRRGRNRPAYDNLDDDEVSSLDDFAPDPVAAATPVEYWDSIDAPEPVGAPEPIAKPRPLDRGYDDIT